VTAPAAPAPSRRNALPVQCFRWTRTCVHVLAGVATTMFVFPLVGATRKRSLVKRWSVRLLRILAVEATIEGDFRAHEGNVLVVANHISWLDIFVLNAVHPVRFVAKSELAKWPVVSQMIRGAGTVFIERERRRDTHRVNHQMARVLAGGDVVAIFPEGTTTDGTDMLPFKSSLLQPIVEAEGHVQPVAIRYHAPDGALSLAPAYVGDTTFAASFWSVCGERRLHVVLRAQPALHARAGHRRELARAAEAAIRTALAAPGRATEPAPPAGPAI
jgi:1-acyl-sn-glycerol-3-phosphate acyltransferase